MVLFFMIESARNGISEQDFWICSDWWLSMESLPVNPLDILY